MSIQSKVRLDSPGQGSEEVLEKILLGVSVQHYTETVIDSAQAFGVSPSSMSHKMVSLTAQQLKALQERSLSEFMPFALFLDTILRGGEAFLIALGMDVSGEKMTLGFWQGSSENHEICEALFNDLERRGLALSRRIIFVTDGGSGLLKALRERFGEKLVIQRCVIPKSLNLQRHLAQRYRNEAHRRLKAALQQTRYADARQMLLELKAWLQTKNESAASSLLEAFEELLTVHRRKVPARLRKTLLSTNPIEGMFSLVRPRERQLVQEKTVLQSQVDSLQQALQASEQEKLQQWVASSEQERVASQARAERERELQEKLLAAEQELRSAEQHWDEKYKEQNDVLLNFQQTSASIQNHLQEQLRTAKYISQQLQQTSIVLQNELAAIKRSLAWRLASPLRKLRRWSDVTSISVSTTPLLLSEFANGDPLSPQLLLDPESHQPSFNEMLKRDKVTETTYTPANHQTSRINSLDDLLALHDEDFVHAAYRVMLGRTPDSEGFKHYLSHIRRGVGKLKIVAQLRASQEGQKQDIKLAGLDEALGHDRWQRLPYIGPALGWLTGENDKGLRGLDKQLSFPPQARTRRFDPLDRMVEGIQQQIEQLVEVVNEQKALPRTIDKPRLHPVNEIFLDTSKGTFWESQGTDPHFSLEINPALFTRGGWCALDLAIHSERKTGVAKFYLDMGDGYTEAESLIVPYNSDEPSERIFQIAKDILGIRFDPQDGKGCFRIDVLQFRAISEADAISAMAGRLAELHESFKGKSDKEIMRFVEEMESECNDSLPQRVANLYSKTFISTQSRIDYEEWIERIERPSLPTAEDVAISLEGLAMKPLISVVMPTYNTPEIFLRSCIESVINQSYQNWELCIADDASPNPEVRRVLDQYRDRDVRIHIVYRPQNGHISAASNSALEIAQGEYAALLDHDDALPEHALYFMVLAINQHPSAKVLYSDEDKIESKGNRFDPHFKSDWNPDLFYSQNYVSHLGVYRRDLLEHIGGFRLGIEGSQDQDLLLRCLPYVAHGEIIHIPRILYHWRAVEGSTAMEAGEKSYTTEAGIKALEDYFKAHGPSNISVEQGLVSNTYRVRWPIPAPAPLVSLLIPTRDRRELIETCVSSILDKSTYKNYEILILDNGSIEPETLTFFKQIQGEDARVKVLRYDYPFNYSAINNFGVKHANGGIIGLVNNDIEVIGSEWLAEMVSHACRPEIGCVGAKLYYGNDTIQHAGVICGLGGVAGHSHKYFPRKAPGYFYRLTLTQTLSAVTAACLLVRREVYEEVGGLDEQNLTIAFNDVDFCLKVRAAGYRNIWTPYAELYHHESISRGDEDTPEKQARFQKEVEFMKNKWDAKLASDPYYSPNLTRDREDFSIGINMV